MSDQLNFLVKPKADLDSELNIGFISAPTISPENTLGVLSTERYVSENQSGIFSFYFSPPGVKVKQATISINSPSFSINGETVFGFNQSFSSTEIVDNGVKISFLTNPIGLKNIVKTDGGCFLPVINNGTVWRFYRVPESEPSWSWLRKAGFNIGDELILCYTVPETFYNTTSFLNPNPPSECRLVSKVETVYASDSFTVFYSGELELVDKIQVNGVDTYTGPFYPNVDQLIKIDSKDKSIRLPNAVQADDKISIFYKEYAQSYLYTGFKFVDETNSISWRSLDLNPEYGREILDHTTSDPYPTSAALFNQVLLYCIPSAACKISYEIINAVDGNINLTLDFISAFQYNETSFVRHYVGISEENFDASIGSSVSFHNQWGVTPFGLDEYDSLGVGSVSSDQFATFLPSMLPIAKVILTGLSTPESFNLVDTRTIGGGLPKVFDNLQLKIQNKEDSIRDLWDLGNWPGNIVNEGGHVIINIPETTLTNYTKEEVEEVVKFYLPIGVSFEINYT